MKLGRKLTRGNGFAYPFVNVCKRLLSAMERGAKALDRGERSRAWNVQRNKERGNEATSSNEARQ